jgi:hypothetical protein
VRFLLIARCQLINRSCFSIDVIKTRIQVDPEFKGQSMLKAGRTIVGREGTSALLTGFGPTAWGYLVQGGLKFAGYEYFKCQLVRQAGGYDTAVPNRTAIYLASARSICNSTSQLLVTRSSILEHIPVLPNSSPTLHSPRSRLRVSASSANATTLLEWVCDFIF